MSENSGSSAVRRFTIWQNTGWERILPAGLMWLQYPFREYRFTKTPLTSRTLFAVETDRRIC